ncbi:hypothetical protein BKA65DRAFT_558073 [Rhexocercosporidium sp. MPI-PUGE-AT-0058]|nr:hypothetical protein BKA65DRAFT_558073 [Rhexocercosporidium sp. MPI-PUGE-AT-0058]
MPYQLLSSEEVLERGITLPPDIPSHIHLKVIAISRLASPYPPPNLHMVENETILNLWEEHMDKVPLSDARLKKKEIQLMDMNRLQYDVQEGENIIFVDDKTNETVLVVVQNLMNDPKIVAVMNGVCIDQLNKTSLLMRLDDAGRMASVGYTSGQHSTGQLLWGKSLKEKNNAEQAYKISCIFAHSWQNALNVLPQDVYDGVVKEYEVTKLGPPSGSISVNYERHIHNEKNLNKYCVSHTTARSHPPEFGGNFYNAAYGIRVPGRIDQLVAWAGSDYHGTSLANVDLVDPKPSFHQSGLAFLLSNRLVDSHKKTERKRKAGVLDNKDFFDPAEGPDSVAFNNKEEIRPKPRAVLPIRKPIKDRGADKVYSKQRIETFHLPADHPYKRWTKKQMIAELDTRNENGKPLIFNSSKKNVGMMYLLLKNDGDEVSVTYADPPRAESGSKSIAGTKDETEEGEYDAADDDWKEEEEDD